VASLLTSSSYPACNVWNLTFHHYSQLHIPHSPFPFHHSPGNFAYLQAQFSTPLVESRTNMRYIQGLPGHNISKTIKVYTPARSKKISEIKSPIDNPELI